MRQLDQRSDQPPRSQLYILNDRERKDRFTGEDLACLGWQRPIIHIYIERCKIVSVKRHISIGRSIFTTDTHTERRPGRQSTSGKSCISYLARKGYIALLLSRWAKIISNLGRLGEYMQAKKQHLLDERQKRKRIYPTTRILHSSSNP
jgi:hypothetical protein